MPSPETPSKAGAAVPSTVSNNTTSSQGSSNYQLLRWLSQTEEEEPWNPLRNDVDAKIVEVKVGNNNSVENVSSEGVKAGP
ncbi:hypothetical protein HD806DRAFT_240410 [Xylariaceae sp. AK1471]|nr:hypothetical protein HD806DRAFT_240410 [Xylariaceae sp. AK1471]